jgi:hypothetical protein
LLKTIYLPSTKKNKKKKKKKKKHEARPSSRNKNSEMEQRNSQEGCDWGFLVGHRELELLQWHLGLHLFAYYGSRSILLILGFQSPNSQRERERLREY